LICNFNTAKEYIDKSDILAVDFETSGLDLTDDNVKVIGAGISSEGYGLYIPFVDLKDDEIKEILTYIAKHPLIFHNASFDIGVFYRYSVWPINLRACTYGLYRQLATEGFLGQSWSLKTAMVQILGWEKDNTDKLKEWFKVNKTKDYSLVPIDIMCEYCAADAYATYKLYQYFLTFKVSFPDLFVYHEDEFCNLITLVVEQQFTGINIDVDKMIAYQRELEETIEQKKKEFFEHPIVKPIVKEYNDAIIKEYLAKKPTVSTKTGKLSVRYSNWEKKWEEVQETNHFNINSKQQLAWLFFDKLGYDTDIRTELGTKSVSKKTLPFFGEVGLLLNTHNLLFKEYTTVSSVINIVRDGKIHITMKVPGTLTGRLSGGANE